MQCRHGVGIDVDLVVVQRRGDCHGRPDARGGVLGSGKVVRAAIVDQVHAPVPLVHLETVGTRVGAGDANLVMRQVLAQPFRRNVLDHVRGIRLDHLPH